MSAIDPELQASFWQGFSSRDLERAPNSQAQLAHCVGAAAGLAVMASITRVAARRYFERPDRMTRLVPALLLGRGTLKAAATFKTSFEDFGAVVDNFADTLMANRADAHTFDLAAE